MIAKLLMVALCVAVSLAAPTPDRPPHGYSSQPSFPDRNPKYAFDYGVQDEYSGAAYRAQETRDGPSTRGGYSVALPDGRILRVTYHVDGDSGYVADVTYEGEARYDDRPQPSYQ